MGLTTSRLAALGQMAPPLMPRLKRPWEAIPGLNLMPDILPADPRGVDLNLDQFNLTKPVQVEGTSWSAGQDVKCAPLGPSFWSSIDGDGSGFREDDRKLLRAVFNPRVSDRRQEGDKFVPPSTSCE